MHLPFRNNQRGAVLFVSLIILAVITILGVSTLSEGMNDIKIAKNNDQMIESVQNADAGVSGVMSLINTTKDPFDSTSHADPFAGIAVADHPLKNLPHVTTASNFIRNAGSCNRSERAFGTATMHCEYYEVVSEDAQAGIGITTTIRQGVLREIIGH